MPHTKFTLGQNNAYKINFTIESSLEKRMINFSDCWIFFTRNRVLSSSNGFKFFFSFFQFSLFFLFSVFFPFLSTCCRLDRGSFNLFYIIKLLSVKNEMENRLKKKCYNLVFSCLAGEVQIFWEVHKIWKNLPLIKSFLGFPSFLGQKHIFASFGLCCVLQDSLGCSRGSRACYGILGY